MDILDVANVVDWNGVYPWYLETMHRHIPCICAYKIVFEVAETLLTYYLRMVIYDLGIVYVLNLHRSRLGTHLNLVREASLPSVIMIGSFHLIL